MERLGQAVADTKARDESGEPSADQTQDADDEEGANDAELADANADANDEALSESDETEDSDKPLTEADAENELLLDRINARMEREGDAANFEQILDEELERRRRERGEAPD